MRSRFRHRFASAAASTVLLVTGAVFTAPPAGAQIPQRPAPKPAATNRGTDAQAAGPFARAAARAKTTGQVAPVESLTDESSTVVANPDGTFTRSSSSMPQRVKQDGTWVPIDSTLVKQKNGSYAPKATPTTMSINGGDSEFASLSEGGDVLRFTWPHALPTPTVSGDTATYAAVLPGVDLQVTADATGYSSILIVKTPEAAANPALQQLDLGLSATNLTVTETANGGAEAVDSATGRPVFHTDTSLMWDSSQPDAAGSRKGATGTPDALSSPQAEHAAAGHLGGHVAEIKVGIRDGKQRLTLDHSLLSAKTTRYPVFVDPIWSGSPGKSQLSWARISSNGWNIYNSTSTSGSDSARIGLDDWPRGDAEQARTYYQMNTSGLKGAIVRDADLFVVERWAASCYRTNAVAYATGNVTGWNAAGLSWGHEPARGALQSTVSGGRIDCGKTTERTNPASLDFTVTSQVKAAAGSKANSATFMVQAQDMSDKFGWKQLGFGGGATLSVTYSFPPKLLNGDGSPAVKPSVVDQGRILTTTHTPTLSSRATNPDLAGGYERVMVDYHVYNSAGNQVAYGYGPTTGFTQYGEDWTVTPALPDGTYTWKVTAENEEKLWASDWGPTQTFTIDTTAPHQPTIASTQFPPDQVGAALDAKGLFALGTDGANNVTGYLFSMDGNLANNGTNHGTAWTTTTVVTPGTVYLAKADNATGTGPVVINGSAGVSFAPGTVGAHTLYVKAVDQAGSTSPQTSYVFNAGAANPTYAYGDKLVTGWTATNTDGTTTVVPPATKNSAGGTIVSQQNFGGYYFADGFQAWLANNGTAKIAVGDTAKFSFDIPSTGAWDVGVNLTTAADYGTYSLTLDAGTPGAFTLLPSFDAYSPSTRTRYRGFGVLKNADNSLLILNQGLHSITLTVIGKNPASPGYQAGIDVIRLAPSPNCLINNTSGCLNNVVTSTYTAGTTPRVTTADGDGSGASIEAADLNAAGWTGGRTVTVNGAAIKLPAAWGTGAKDNMLAAGQFVIVPASGVVNKGNAVVFVGFATGTKTIKKISGQIYYAAGTGCEQESQPYTIDTVRDWGSGAAGSLLSLPHRNKSDNTQATAPTSLFSFSVPLVCPGATVTTVSLPLVSSSVLASAASVHFLGLGIRPLAATGTVRWSGSWAVADDTGFVQSQPTGSTTSTVNATLNAQTIRIPARLSLGGDGQARIRLSNIIGKVPVSFDAASIALQDGTAGGATAAGPPVPLTFGGSRGAALPPGTDLVSDPVALATTMRGTVLVSLKVHGSVASVAGHLDARSPVYLSASDDVDHTGEAAGTSYTLSTFTGLPYLTAIDVSTPANSPTGSLVLYGDQTVNADTGTADGRSRLSDVLATTLANEDSTGHTVPFGILNKGSSSWNNRVLLPVVGDDIVANSANGTVDQLILSQSGVHSVLVSAGSTDLLSCTGTFDTCAKTVQDKLVALVTQLHQYRTDDKAALKVDVATLPPFAGAHTAAQEAAREQVNAYILNVDSPLALHGYADGVIDFAAAVSTGGNDTSDTIKIADLFTSGGKTFPNDLYFQDLATQYIADALTGDQDDSGAPGTRPVAQWNLDEGAGTNATDSGFGTGVDSNRTLHPATLHNTTWGAGRLTDDKAPTFNGASSYADTGLPMDTTHSFTVSLWARLTDKSTDHTVFSREARGVYAALYLKYQAATDRWLAEMPSTTSGTPIFFDALSSSTPPIGVWTHLAVAYDAELHSLTLYVNGTAETGLEEVIPFTDVTGTTYIGRSDVSFFTGNIADVQVWARATDPAEMAAAADPPRIGNWDLDDGGGTVALDSSIHHHDGTLSGGTQWFATGHTDLDAGSIGFNGTNAAVSAATVLRTNQSFTVSGWANLSSTAKSATLISQDGSHASAFQLGYDKGCGCWAFSLPTGDADGAGTVTAAAPPSSTTLGAWTHLAGVYDAVNGTATLYVAGVPVSSVAVPVTQWAGAGAFVIGRGRANSANTDWFAGRIDAVQAFQGALSDGRVWDEYGQ